jgi:hypothetical protein
LNPQHGGSLAPELVKLVELPLEGGKDMDYSVAVVEQEPAGVYRPFVVVRQDALVFKPVPDFIIDSGNLPVGLAAAYHEIVGKAAHPAGVQQNNIDCLFIGGGLYRLARYIQCFQ